MSVHRLDMLDAIRFWTVVAGGVLILRAAIGIVRVMYFP